MKTFDARPYGGLPLTVGPKTESRMQSSCRRASLSNYGIMMTAHSLGMTCQSLVLLLATDGSPSIAALSLPLPQDKRTGSSDAVNMSLFGSFRAKTVCGCTTNKISN